VPAIGRCRSILDTGSIINLNKPIATGNFRAKFPAADLNEILGNKVARFTRVRRISTCSIRAIL